MTDFGVFWTVWTVSAVTSLLPSERALRLLKCSSKILTQRLHESDFRSRALPQLPRLTDLLELLQRLRPREVTKPEVFTSVVPSRVAERENRHVILFSRPRGDRAPGDLENDVRARPSRSGAGLRMLTDTLPSSQP